MTAPAASKDTTLSGLKIGNLELSPVFASGTKSYTATTTNVSNVVTAIPANAGAEIEVKIADADGDESFEIDNGTAAKWYDGENTLTVKVTAADGDTTDTYTVTVTKSGG